MPTLLIATASGLHTLDERGVVLDVAHDGRAVVGLGRAGSAVWAVVDGSEIWSNDVGAWRHTADLPDVRATCIAGIGGKILVGSSQARLFDVSDGTAVRVAGFDEAPGRSTWYTPWGGPPDTRSITNWDDDIYVNVHVGGVLRTSDGGVSWTPTIDIDDDVHHVTTAEGQVFAACAHGLAVSSDRGSSWSYRTAGLEAVYSRSVAVCGDVVLVAASDGPRGGHAGIYRGDLADGAFERCRTGLPEWFDDNIDTYCLEALPEGELAAFGTTDGRVFISEDLGETWSDTGVELAPIGRVLLMP